MFQLVLILSISLKEGAFKPRDVVCTGISISIWDFKEKILACMVFPGKHPREFLPILGIGCDTPEKSKSE